MVKKGVRSAIPPKPLQIRNSTVEFSVAKDSLVTDIKEITARFNYRGILGSYRQWINNNFQI